MVGAAQRTAAAFTTLRRGCRVSPQLASRLLRLAVSWLPPLRQVHPPPTAHRLIQPASAHLADVVVHGAAAHELKHDAQVGLLRACADELHNVLVPHLAHDGHLLQHARDGGTGGSAGVQLQMLPHRCTRREQSASTARDSPLMTGAAPWPAATQNCSPSPPRRLPHLQELLELLAVLVHIPQDLDRHVLAAVGASEQVAKRAWRQGQGMQRHWQTSAACDQAITRGYSSAGCTTAPRHAAAVVMQRQRSHTQRAAAAVHPPDAIFSWKMISLGSSSQSLSAALVVACCRQAQQAGTQASALPSTTCCASRPTVARQGRCAKMTGLCCTQQQPATTVQQPANNSLQATASRLDAQSHIPTRQPSPPPPHPRQHIQLLLRHPQLLLPRRGGRAAAGAAHHRRRQLLQPPAEHLLQLLCAAARPAVDHKHVQREAVLGVEGVRLADVQPKVALPAGKGWGRRA